jgi:hypothetical protein
LVEHPKIKCGIGDVEDQSNLSDNQCCAQKSIAFSCYRGIMRARFAASPAIESALKMPLLCMEMLENFI